MRASTYQEDPAYNAYYRQQEELVAQLITEDQFETPLEFIGGVDVAYDESTNRMIGAMVVLHAETLAIVEEAYHEMEITFPYVPGLFSFREVPSLTAAFQKLSTKPQLIICDGHGIAHPKKMGLASHLGISLDLPTIGCGKRSLITPWDKAGLAMERAASVPLSWEGENRGVALRTQPAIKPVFVSIGHRVSLETAIAWTLKMSPKYRLPETTRAADQLVNALRRSLLRGASFEEEE
ncbi:MAG: deoxyribonuclease V [Saprospiraceae bacterium]